MKRVVQHLLPASRFKRDRHPRCKGSNSASPRSALAHHSGSVVTLEPEALSSGAPVVEPQWGLA